jgi:hypothetical protein
VRRNIGMKRRRGRTTCRWQARDGSLRLSRFGDDERLPFLRQLRRQPCRMFPSQPFARCGKARRWENYGCWFDMRHSTSACS